MTNMTNYSAFSAIFIGGATLSLAGCGADAGGKLFTFPAFARGSAPLTAPGRLEFENGRGYAVELTRAELHIGALYLNRSRPSSVSSDTSCTQAGVYVAEVLAGRDIDLLSDEPQYFPEAGFATTDASASAEVWLMGADINDTSDATPILRVEGTARRDAENIAFMGRLTIGPNRAIAPTNPSQPGASPICKQRIVSPIRADLPSGEGAVLALDIDARRLFANVDFATLPAPGGTGTSYVFADETGVNQASDNLYGGLRSSSGVYEFSWKEKPE